MPHANEQYTVKVKCRPTVLDNIDHWQVFENDKQIENFLQPETKFEILKPELIHQEACFDEEQTLKIDLAFKTDINLLEYPLKEESLVDLDQKYLEELQCKDNSLPRDLSPLEELFDFNDVARNPKWKPPKLMWKNVT